MSRRVRATPRGFTLIEVMVAVTILGLGLTMILSSQVGLFASVQRVQNETVATSLMRCRMTEIELELMIKGFPLIDQNDNGECCEDEDTPGFTCSWKVETIELPQPAMIKDNKATQADAMKNAKSALGGKDPLSALASAAPSGSAGSTVPPGLPGMGALGALASMEDTKGATLGPNAKPADVASSFGAAAPAGPAGMATMAMGLVYPTLKPMLEASIRKVSVQVLWSEGRKEKNFSVVQYLTDPRKGSLNPNAAAGLDAINQMINPGSDSATTSGTGTGTTGSSSSGSTK